MFNFFQKSAYLELHIDYKPDVPNWGWYKDFWIKWIKCSPLPIKYVDDDRLKYREPVAFCNLVVKGKRFTVGFDLWDYYYVYAHDTLYGEKDPELIATWDSCIVKFKAQYFDVDTPHRYHQVEGYVPKDIDDKAKRKACEEAYYTDNIYPLGMLLNEGDYYVSDKYVKYRNHIKRSIDISSRQKAKPINDVRNGMAALLGNQTVTQFGGTYEEYLKDLGNSKIVIDYPSNSRVTFRTAEALSLGALLVGTPINTLYPMDFRLEDLIVTCKTDLSDFKDLINEHLEDNQKREAITRKAMSEYDRVMAPRPLSKYWIDTALRHIG